MGTKEARTTKIDVGEADVALPGRVRWEAAGWAAVLEAGAARLPVNETCLLSPAAKQDSSG